MPLALTGKVYCKKDERFHALNLSTNIYIGYGHSAISTETWVEYCMALDEPALSLTSIKTPRLPRAIATLSASCGGQQPREGSHGPRAEGQKDIGNFFMVGEREIERCTQP